jgi:polyisoprenoid-binding protein YceI
MRIAGVIRSMARIPFAVPMLLACALGASESVAGPLVFRVDPDRTTARFAVAQLGVEKEHGRLGRTTGTIRMDAQRRVERVDFEIDTRAVNTGWDLRDAFLRSGVMFDTDRYPRMEFRSTRIVYDGARLTTVEGDVTLRGVTRPVRLAVKRLECAARGEDGDETCGAEVVGRISRGAFGMDFLYPLIPDEVDLEFHVTATRGRDAEETKEIKEAKKP